MEKITTLSLLGQAAKLEETLLTERNSHFEINAIHYVFKLVPRSVHLYHSQKTVNKTSSDTHVVT